MSSKKPLLSGIKLDDKQNFREWAESILPWINGVMLDVSQGITGDIADLLARQERYTGYAGAVVELYAKADAYYKTALAEAMEKAQAPPSLVARIAAGKCRNEIRVYDAIHRLNATLSDQLIAIAARLKFEKAIHGESGSQPPF